MPFVSLRAYARHRRCTLSMIQKSIANGRLERSIHRVGGRLRLDVAEADREWVENRDVSKLRDQQPPPADPALPLYAASCALVALAEKSRSA